MGSQERENYFGEGVAERYDDSSSEMFDPAVIEPTVDFLAGLAEDGAALELGIGTGRVALPLSRRGVTVCGIDLSSAMVEQLQGEARRRPDPGHARRLRHHQGSGRVHARLPGLQHDQQPDHAGRSGGLLPERRRAPRARRMLRDRGRRPSAPAAAPGRDGAPVHGHEPDGSASTSTTSPTRAWSRTTTGWRTTGSAACSVPFRYVWPAELDLMARLAGMTLRERWSGWNREPFTSESRKHISVWQKAT